ncbi:MAG: phosphoglucosamine mutase [Planctomycetaceae bacterium]|nr:phosphoglucosamine mutase [Planctomycetaceae bacterium]
MTSNDAPLMLSVSGLRGLVGKTITAEVAALYGAAFGSHLRSKKNRPRVVLARDSRPSGEAFLSAVAAGLASTGCDVIDLGIAMTPTAGVMVQHHKADGGMVCTASHNPIEWNGLKCLDGDGVAPPPDEAKEIVRRFKERDLKLAGPTEFGRIERDTGADATHVAKVLALVDVAAIRAANLKVVVDSVNGAGCNAARMLLEKLGVGVTHLNGEPTGLFAHTPEPTQANLTDLAAATAKGGFACGFAQDPDADRLAVVDEAGRYIGEEYTLALCALRILQREGKATMAANLSTSRMIDGVAAKFAGSKVLRTAVGEANVVAAMKSAGSTIGGEGNGGVIWPKVCWVRDSLSGMALVLELLATQKRALSVIAAEIPRFAMVKRKLELGAIGGAAAVAPALAKVKAAFAGERMDECDGIRIDLAEGWVHLRASNTEPIIRLISEAANDAAANALADRVAKAAGLP